MMMPPCRRQSQIVNGARSKAVPAVFKGIIELLAVTQQWEKAQFDIEEVQGYLEQPISYINSVGELFMFTTG